MKHWVNDGDGLGLWELCPSCGRMHPGEEFCPVCQVCEDCGEPAGTCICDGEQC